MTYNMKFVFNFLVWTLLYFHAALAQTADLSGSLDAFFQKAARNGYSGSVLVAHKGKVLLEKGYGMQDPETGKAQSAETVFSIGSITKQFTAAAVLKLEDQGKLSVQDPLSKYFPDAPAARKNITLHQLLTHSAGFPGAIGDDYELLSIADFVREAFASEAVFPPGTGYEYSNVGYSLLGIIVEKVSGKTYEHYLRDNLWLPAGMAKPGYALPGHKPAALAVGYRDGQRWGTALDHPWGADGPGWHLKANGGVLSTVGDMYRWYEALQTDKVLSAAARAKYFTKHVLENNGQTHYGYGWVVADDPNFGRQIWHNGGNGVYNAFMGFSPDTKTCIIVSSNTNQKISDDYALVVSNLLVGKHAALPGATLERWSGRYQLPDGTDFTLRFNELDHALIEVNTPALFALLIGNGDEKPSEMAALTARVKNAVEQLAAGQYAPFAELRQAPEAMVRRNQSAAWADFRRDWGAFKGVEALGSANRPRMNAQLTMLRLNFERHSLVFTYIWRDGMIDDFRSEPALLKAFEPDGEGRFFAGSNQATLLFQTDGTLVVEQGGKKVRATKL